MVRGSAASAGVPIGTSVHMRPTAAPRSGPAVRRGGPPGGAGSGGTRRGPLELAGGGSAAAGAVDRDGDAVAPPHGRAPATARTGLPGEALTGAHGGHLRAADVRGETGDRWP